MTTLPVRVERRVGQRFLYLLSLTLRHPLSAIEGVGFTQDLSSRGVFFFTDATLTEGAEIELTLRMPSEITLGDNMRVRCRGRVLRVTKPTAQAPPHSAETKIGVAVRFEHYKYLTEAALPAYSRVSSLQHGAEEDREYAHSSARS